MSSEDEDRSNSLIYAALAGNLGEMVNNSELSDITFVCEDGVEVHACRMLLAARSAFFRRMLLNGRVESRDSTVKLPNVTSPVLILVLKFLYVGKLSEEDLYPSMAEINAEGGTEIVGAGKNGSFRLDWNLLVKVVLAARLFMVDGLGRVLIDKLSSDLLGENSHSEDSVNRNASRLSTICGYQKLWTGEEAEVKSIEAICSSILNVLMTHDLSLSTLLLMSEEAFSYYLSTESRRIFSGERYCEWSLDEYLLLRQILTWCAIRDNDGLGDLRNLDLTCLPGPDVAIQLLKANEEKCEVNLDRRFNFNPGRTYLLNAIAKESLKPLLNMVDLVSIHPELLCNVIQPLNIIDPAQLSKALGRQAVRSSRRLRTREISSVWHLLVCEKYKEWFCPTYTGLRRVQDNDCFTLTPSQRDEDIWMGVTAVVGLQILTHKCKKYEWEFVAIPSGSVGQCTMADFEFGFYCLGQGEAFYWDSDYLQMRVAEDPHLASSSSGGNL